jgi:hypothetical protein
MTSKELDELQALADAATPGPWEFRKYGISSPTVPVVSWMYEWEDCCPNSAADSDFICAVREAVPKLIQIAREYKDSNSALLIAKIRELETELARTKK